MDFENQYIHVQPKDTNSHTIEWEPKDHECRVVPIVEETAQLLANLQAYSPIGFPYVFISPARLTHIRQKLNEGKWNSRRESINNMMKNFCNLCKKAGIAKCSIHDLRRSAITNWAQHLPIQVVQQFAGHSNITTTRLYYLAVRPENMASAAKTINKIFQEAKLGLTQK